MAQQEMTFKDFNLLDDYKPEKFYAEADHDRLVQEAADAAWKQCLVEAKTKAVAKQKEADKETDTAKKELLQKEVNAEKIYAEDLKKYNKLKNKSSLSKEDKEHLEFWKQTEQNIREYAKKDKGEQLDLMFALSDGDYKLFEKDKESFVRNYQIREAAGTDPNFKDTVKATMGEHNGKPELAVRMDATGKFEEHGFGFTIRENKISFDGEITPEYLRYMRAWLEFRGIGGIEFPEATPQKLKDEWNKAGDELNAVRFDESKDEWFAEFFNNLWKKKPEIPQMPIDGESRHENPQPEPEEATPVPEPEPSAKKDKEKSDGIEMNNNFDVYFQRWLKNNGRYLNSNYYYYKFGDRRTYKIYKGRIDAKDAKPELIVRAKPIRVNGKKTLAITWSTPDNAQLPQNYADVIVELFQQQGATHIDFGRQVTEEDSFTLRVACARKGAIPMGVNIKKQHLDSMFKEAFVRQNKDELPVWLRRMAVHLAESNKGKLDKNGKETYGGMGKTIRRLNRWAKLLELNDDYGGTMREEIQAALRKHDVPLAVGASKAAQAVIDAMNEYRKLPDLLQIYKDKDAQWKEDSKKGKETGTVNPWTEINRLLKAKIKEHGENYDCQQLTNAEVMAIYEEVKKAETIDAYRMIYNEQAQKQSRRNIDDEENDTSLNTISWNYVRGAIGELNSATGSVNRIAMGGEYPDYDPISVQKFPYIAKGDERYADKGYVTEREQVKKIPLDTNRRQPPPQKQRA